MSKKKKINKDEKPGRAKKSGLRLPSSVVAFASPVMTSGHD